MNDYSTMGGFGMGFGWVFTALFIAALLYFINNLSKGDVSAKDVLDKKFANGEIDEEEYKIKKEALRS